MSKIKIFVSENIGIIIVLLFILTISFLFFYQHYQKEETIKQMQTSCDGVYLDMLGNPSCYCKSGVYLVMEGECQGR